jgi:hypothetical protein
VLLFLAAIISAFWYLRNEEIERETESVKRDTEIAQQQIRLRLIENQEQLVRMAREIVTRAIDQDEFVAQAATFTRERPRSPPVWITRTARAASYSSPQLPRRGQPTATCAASLPCRARKRARSALHGRARPAPAGLSRAFATPRHAGVPAAVPLIDAARSAAR